MKIDLIAGACENGCKVKHTYNLPEDYNKCFKYVKFKSSEMANEKRYLLENAKHFIEGTSPCIGNHDKYSVNISFVKQNGEECKYEKTVYCKGKPVPLEELCTPDCSDDKWNEIKELTVVSDICPGCTINVSYTWRIACNNYQDVQIVKFEVLNDNCQDCSPEKLYQMALEEIIRNNEMLFKPRIPGDCSSLWRVAQASCWAVWRYYYDDGLKEKGYVDVYELCKKIGCCLQKVEVCLDKDGKYIVTPIGNIETYNNDCKNITIDNDNHGSANCFPACDWLAKYKGFNAVVLKKKNKIRFKIDYENAYGLNTGIEDNILKVHIKAPKPGNAEVTVYDVSGKQVIKEKAVITNEGINSIIIGIADLQSGNYIYTVTIDGRKLESQKFNINK